jgi:bacillithiol system protein YtxJ
MPDTLRHLTTLDDLTASLARSWTHPIFLFKHSETCGMSFEAREEVLAALAGPDWDIDVYLVSVQRSRLVSNAIAERLQVRHASPQLLFVGNGEVRWQATHLSITAEAMRRTRAPHAQLER